MKNRLMLLLVLATTLLLPVFVMAADQEQPTIYVVKKGDTLWGLSERFIKDPHYWPNLWANNGEITNPHLIYPGQQVRVFPDRLEVVPLNEPVQSGGQKASTVAKAADTVRQVAEERRFMVRGSEGYLMEKDTRPFGYVIGIHSDRVVAGVDDIVYTDIGARDGVQGGERFSIFRVDSQISHPVSNEILGRKVVPLGTLQLTDIEKKASRAIITKNYSEISTGAMLMPYRNSGVREVALKMTTRDLKGYLLENSNGTVAMALGDIVYIDLGSEQGVEPGNMLYIVRDVKLERKVTFGRVDVLPQELLGAVVVLETGKRTSTALIVKSVDALYKGDKLVALTR